MPSKSARKNRRARCIPSQSASGEDIESVAAPLSDSGAGNDEEDEPGPSSRRRLKHRELSHEDESSSDEDTEKLLNEVDEDCILKTRLRARNKPTAHQQIRQQNLERLKRRRQKEEDPEDESKEGDDDSGDPSTGGSEESADDASSMSSDFVIKDSDENLVQLPAEFRMETYQETEHQFKSIFHFFVCVAVRPIEERRTYMEEILKEDESFSIPLRVTRRRLSSMLDSLVASSVWRPAYRRSLEKYPKLSLTRLESVLPHCDACHLPHRKATLVGRSEGEPYDPIGFQTIRDEEDEKPQFNLGQFCSRRSRVYHEFSHWEYYLFSAISKELDTLRPRSTTEFYRVPDICGREPPDDLTDPDAVCEWLEKRNLIDMEWQKLKKMMESAHYLEIDGKTGDDVDWYGGQ